MSSVIPKPELKWLDKAIEEGEPTPKEIIAEAIANLDTGDGKLKYYDVLKDMEAKFEVFTDIVTSERFVVDANGETRQFSDSMDIILTDYFTETYKQPPRWIPDIIKSFQNGCINNRENTHLRCAQVASGESSEIVYRLTNTEAVNVSRDGWSVGNLHDTGIRFRDTALNVDCVRPVDTEIKLNEIIKDSMPIFKENIIPYLGTLTTMFMENIASPLLNIYGDQGSFKTGAGAATKHVSDPISERLSISGDSLPSVKKDLVLKLSSQSSIVFDNISSLTPMQSDALARSVTGGYESIRDLYTTRHMVNVPMKCAPIFTGIHNVIDKSDLADRTVNLQLDRFVNFESEVAVIDRIMGNVPETLGAIFNVMVEVLDYTGEPINPLNLRLTDFSTITHLVGRHCGYSNKEIRSALSSNREINKDNIRESSSLMTWISQNVTKEIPWSGSSADLFKVMKATTSTPFKNEVGVGKDLKAKQLSLFDDGFVVTKTRKNSARKYEIRVKEPGDVYVSFKKQEEST